MVQFQRVRYGNLKFRVVVLSFAVQVDPDASHGEGMCRLRLVNVGNWNTLKEKKIKAI